MKKIFVYIGSQKGEHSNTFKFAKAILERCISINSDISYEMTTSDQLSIKPCLGCCLCFEKGTCPLASSDDSLQIKQKILLSDMVIFGSPVYAHNVSGDMKHFIDRISHWFHNMRLHGKYSAVISTTMSNGHLTAVTYLEKMTAFLGMKSLFKIGCAINDSDEYGNKEWVTAKVSELATRIATSLTEPIKTDMFLERNFRTLKERYQALIDTGQSIENYSELTSENFMGYNSFQEFLDRKKN